MVKLSEPPAQIRRRLPRDLLWKSGTAGAAGLLLSFMLLPIIALIATLSWDEFVAGITHHSVWPALKLSLLTTSTSLAAVIVLGTPLAWLISRRRGRLIQLIETLVRLPAVLPPAVAGVALLLAFGRRGLLGGWLADIGWPIPFTTSAVIMAEIFVSAPFFLQAAVSSFRTIDEDQLTVARTLGSSPAGVFFRVAVPLAMPGLIAGAAMSWARALGEFGATLMFAGNLEGKTQTLTLAVYTTFESDMRAAQALSLILVVVAFTLLYTLTSKTGRGGRRAEDGVALA
jgi:molybdate transport system permease protein